MKACEIRTVNIHGGAWLSFVEYHHADCFLAITFLPGISFGAIQNTRTSGVYQSLEDAVAAANDGDTLLLISNTSVTLTSGQGVQISKSLTIKQNDTASYGILLNGTIAFNGNFKTYSLTNGLDIDQGISRAILFSYDPTGQPVFQNNSLIEITGSSNTFSIPELHPKLDPGTFNGTGVNLTGNSNALNSWIGEIYSGTSQLSVVFNLAGSYNSISDSLTCPLDTAASGGIGLRVTGNFNGAPGSPTAAGPVTGETSPPIFIDTRKITSAPGGRIYIAPSANGNVIQDDNFNLNTQPQIYLSNGTAATQTTSWYFFEPAPGRPPAGTGTSLFILLHHGSFPSPETSAWLPVFPTLQGSRPILSRTTPCRWMPQPTRLQENRAGVS